MMILMKQVIQSRFDSIFSTEPHLINQFEMNDLVRDLDLSKNKLQDWKDGFFW